MRTYAGYLKNKTVNVGTAVGVVSAAILMVGVGVGFEPSMVLLLGGGLAGLVGYRRRKRMI